jgi:DNA-directed RNA polymerase sigma subunit (sigma70/sigma32)
MLSKLNVLERRVMEVRYFMGPEPLTLEESAEVLAMDPSEVASVEERAILKLSKLD